MKFSVIIPAYNCEDTIEATVRSITATQMDEMEIIIVDDGSTDQSRTICEQLIESFPNIKYFLKKNSGVSDTRNYGIERATGKYVLLWDSDDLAESELLRKCMQKVLEQDCDMLVFGIEYRKMFNGKLFGVDKLQCQKEEMIFKRDLSDRLNELFEINYLQSACNKILRRDICNYIRFSSSKRSFEDFLYIIEYIKYCESIYIMPDLVYLYNVEYSSKKPTREKAISDFNAYMLEFQEAVLELEENLGTTLTGLRAIVGLIYGWMLENKIASSNYAELKKIDPQKMRACLFGDIYQIDSKLTRLFFEGRLLLVWIYRCLKEAKQTILFTLRYCILNG